VVDLMEALSASVKSAQQGKGKSGASARTPVKKAAKKAPVKKVAATVAAKKAPPKAAPRRKAS
jgi:hypothetical protein